MHNLITFFVVFTNKNGGGVDSIPPPQIKGVFNTPSKLRLKVKATKEKVTLKTTTKKVPMTTKLEGGGGVRP